MALIDENNAKGTGQQTRLLYSSQFIQIVHVFYW